MPAPDDEFKKRVKKIRKERMFMIDRRREVQRGAVVEVYSIAGSRGNLYTTTIGPVPKCDCPDFVSW